MRFLIAVVIFLVSVFLEIVFVPRGLGVFLPISFWASAGVFAVFESRRLLSFAILAGFLKTLFAPSLGAFFMTIFIASALVAILARRLLGTAGFISDAATLAAALFSFEIFGLLFYDFFAPTELAPSSVYFAATFPKEILTSALFLMFAGLGLYFYDVKRSAHKLLHV